MRSLARLLPLSFLVTLACTEAAGPPVEVDVVVYSTTHDPIQTTFVGPASDAVDFRDALRDELSGQQGFADGTTFLSVSGADGQIVLTPIDPALALEIQSTVDAVSAAFDFEGPALAVDVDFKEDGIGKQPPPGQKPVKCCKKVCPDSWPTAGTCDYFCSETGCAGGNPSGGPGGGGGPSVCTALCYAPTIGPCFDHWSDYLNPACYECKSHFCL